MALALLSPRHFLSSDSVLHILGWQFFSVKVPLHLSEIAAISSNRKRQFIYPVTGPLVQGIFDFEPTPFLTSRN